MPLSAGDKLGPYEIVAPLGAGGMGQVYRARDPKLNRDVAIKVLSPAFADDAERMQRFEREAQVLASLNHPNIAQIYGVEQGAIVMELVEGADLKGPLPLDTVLEYARQIAAGLDAAHEKGIIHRDLKPANIKVTPEGTVKLLDFGLAKSAEPSAAAGSASLSPTLTLQDTRAGVILGTAAYMSPEQARGKPVDKRADIWAFGVVLYELVTGKRLFGGEDLTETLASVVKDTPDLSGVPAPLRRLLEQCLEKDPKKRLRDIGDMELWLKAETGEATGRGTRGPSHTRGPWIAVAAIFALAAVGLAFFAAPHFREKRSSPVKFQIPPPEKGAFNLSIGPLVSPDGRRIAFRASGDGKRGVWVRDLDSLDIRLLPGTENAGNLAWSPDSRQLAFVSGNQLLKIDLAGGPPTVIVSESVFDTGAAWGKDGVILFVLDRRLFRVSAAGGPPSPMTELDTSRNEYLHAAPQFLPDGRHFLFVSAGTGTRSAVFVADLKSKDKKLVIPITDSHACYVDPGYLLFAREHVLMAQPFDAAKLQTTGDPVPVIEGVATAGYSRYFHASSNGTFAYASGLADSVQLTWYDRSGKTVGILGKPADTQAARISPNGKMVVFERLDQQTGRRDIWVADLARGSEQRLTFEGENLYPLWSPDSLRVAFSQFDKGKRQIAVKAIDGAGSPEMLESGWKYPSDWTSDGRYLITVTAGVTPKTSNDLWALPMADGRAAGKAVPLRQTEFAEMMGRVSPDGRWLAYTSDESKRLEVYVVGFPSMTGHWQVSVNGGTQPVWSRDGRELYFVGSNANKIMAVDISPGSQFQAGVPKPLFDVQMIDRRWGFDVGPDGRFLIPTLVGQPVSPITVVVNWQPEIKK